MNKRKKRVNRRAFRASMSCTSNRRLVRACVWLCGLLFRDHIVFNTHITFIISLRVVVVIFFTLLDCSSFIFPRFLCSRKKRQKKPHSHNHRKKTRQNKVKHFIPYYYFFGRFFLSVLSSFLARQFSFQSVNAFHSTLFGCYLLRINGFSYDI